MHAHSEHGACMLGALPNAYGWQLCALPSATKHVLRIHLPQMAASVQQMNAAQFNLLAKDAQLVEPQGKLAESVWARLALVLLPHPTQCEDPGAAHQTHSRVCAAAAYQHYCGAVQATEPRGSSAPRLLVLTAPRLSCTQIFGAGCLVPCAVDIIFCCAKPVGSHRLPFKVGAARPASQCLVLPLLRLGQGLRQPHSLV